MINCHQINGRGACHKGVYVATQLKQFPRGFWHSHYISSHVSGSTCVVTFRNGNWTVGVLACMSTDFQHTANICVWIDRGEWKCSRDIRTMIVLLGNMQKANKLSFEKKSSCHVCLKKVSCADSRSAWLCVVIWRSYGFGKKGDLRKMTFHKHALNVLLGWFYFNPVSTLVGL